MTWGQSFQMRREALGVSRFDLADELNLSDRLVSGIEAGRINPNSSFVAKLDKALIAASMKKAPGASAVRAADQEPSKTETNRQEGTTR